MDLSVQGNQTGTARDALGGTGCGRGGWTLRGWEPQPDAGFWKVSGTKGALPTPTTRGRQRPGLPHQFVWKLIELQKSCENKDSVLKPDSPSFSILTHSLHI